MKARRKRDHERWQKAKANEIRLKQNRERGKLYRETPHGRKVMNAAHRRWQKTEKGKLANRLGQHTRRARVAGAGGIITRQEWLRLVVDHGGKCAYCGKKDGKLTLDHVVPISRGGANTIDNAAPACWWCNSHKHNRTGDEFRAAADGPHIRPAVLKRTGT